ncbi:MAG: hypothetical protein AAF318_01530 [Pseudomonadota bacterium]
MRVLILLALLLAPAHAHETSEERIRVLILTQDNDATVVYLRQPAALLFAKEAARRTGPSATITSTFFHPKGPAHRFDRTAIAAAPDSFATRILATIHLEAEPGSTEPKVLKSALHHVTALGTFNAPAEAEAALNTAAGQGAPHVASAYVDAKITAPDTGDLTLHFPLDAIAFPGHVHLHTAIVDARFDPPTRRVVLGPITRPIALSAP